jgi:hypothetical protein
MLMADIYDQNNKQVSTWISMKDYAMLQHLAFKNKVTLAAYMRAILVDAVQEEVYSSQLSPTITSNHSIV